jgi:acyl-CoA thioester hydrolase
MTRVTAADEYGVLVPVPLRWSDMDAYGHVNNTDILRLLEQARIEGLPLVREPGTTGFLVVRHEIEYLRPLDYRPDGVTIRMWTVRIGGAGFDLGYDVGPGSPYARAASTLVAFDFRAGRPRRLWPEERRVLAAIDGPPVAFRRSSARATT